MSKKLRIWILMYYLSAYTQVQVAIQSKIQNYRGKNNCLQGKINIVFLMLNQNNNCRQNFFFKFMIILYLAIIRSWPFGMSWRRHICSWNTIAIAILHLAKFSYHGSHIRCIIHYAIFFHGFFSSQMMLSLLISMS